MIIVIIITILFGLNSEAIFYLLTDMSPCTPALVVLSTWTLIIWGCVSVYRLGECLWSIKCSIYTLHVLHVHCIIYIVLIFLSFSE